MARKKVAAKKKTGRGRAQSTTPPETPTGKKLVDKTFDTDNGVLTCMFDDNTQCQFILKTLTDELGNVTHESNLSPYLKTIGLMYGIQRRLESSRDAKATAAEMFAGKWPTRGRAAGGGAGRIGRTVIAWARAIRIRDEQLRQAYTEDQMIATCQASWKNMTIEAKEEVEEDYLVKAQKDLLRREAKGGEADLVGLLKQGGGQLPAQSETAPPAPPAQPPTHVPPVPPTAVVTPMPGTVPGPVPPMPNDGSGGDVVVDPAEFPPSPFGPVPGAS